MNIKDFATRWALHYVNPDFLKIPSFSSKVKEKIPVQFNFLLEDPDEIIQTDWAEGLSLNAFSKPTPLSDLYCIVSFYLFNKKTKNYMTLVNYYDKKSKQYVQAAIDYLPAGESGDEVILEPCCTAINSISIYFDEGDYSLIEYSITRGIIKVSPIEFSVRKVSVENNLIIENIYHDLAYVKIGLTGEYLYHEYESQADVKFETSSEPASPATRYSATDSMIATGAIGWKIEREKAKWRTVNKSYTPTFYIQNSVGVICNSTYQEHLLFGKTYRDYGTVSRRQSNNYSTIYFNYDTTLKEIVEVVDKDEFGVGTPIVLLVNYWTEICRDYINEGMFSSSLWDSSIDESSYGVYFGYEIMINGVTINDFLAAREMKTNYKITNATLGLRSYRTKTLSKEDRTYTFSYEDVASMFSEDTGYSGWGFLTATGETVAPFEEGGSSLLSAEITNFDLINNTATFEEEWPEGSGGPDEYIGEPRYNSDVDFWYKKEYMYGTLTEEGLLVDRQHRGTESFSRGFSNTKTRIEERTQQIFDPLKPKYSSVNSELYNNYGNCILYYFFKKAEELKEEIVITPVTIREGQGETNCFGYYGYNATGETDSAYEYFFLQEHLSNKIKYIIP